MWQQHFNKGDTVEVLTKSNDEATYCYHAATILRSPAKKRKKKNTLYVEYQTIKVPDEDGSSRPLREHVDASRVRPPPQTAAETGRGFGLCENVDAFDGNRWKVGSVVGILMNSKYLVVFGDKEEQVEFEGCDLRIHRDWNDGFWTPPLEEMVSTNPSSQVRFVKGSLKARCFFSLTS